MTVRHPFEERFAVSWPPQEWQQVGVVVAVSGGSDSVGLLRAMIRLRDPSTGGLFVAHFNHQWRGSESDADEAFVRTLAEQGELTCEVGQGERLNGTDHGDGLEAAARQQRYRFLREVADRVGARFVATGHTADDQVETILHRIVRGTGVAGLAGIPRTRLLSPLTTVVRPLLAFRRREVQDYLKDLHQPYRTDSSNRVVGFTRNRIRHELLPVLERDYNPRVSDAVERLGDLARQAQQVIDSQVEGLQAQCVTWGETGCVRIERGPLRDQPPFLVRELLIAIWRQQQWPLRHMSGGKWGELSDLVQSTQQTRAVVILPGEIRVVRLGQTAELTAPEAGAP
ncbi:MAG: tRNA lysidine(34) synthetase TilS [Pirellulaceae bacterium]